ncbi:hypothetical protein A7K94_0206300 [Modestobacter sp. VKM Ac-2676]|nr:hypothetical protein A7K94_0206300 [Modestobacter sp. VKM Ac-2676]
MEWVLVLLAVGVAVASVVYVGSRRRRWERMAQPEFPSNDPPGRGAGAESEPPDARGAISKNSWMLGGGGSGG